MASFSIIHWLILLPVYAVWVVPLYRILKRIGWSPGWAFVAFLPPAALIILWCIAFGDWRSPGAAKQ